MHTSCFVNLKSTKPLLTSARQGMGGEGDAHEQSWFSGKAEADTRTRALLCVSAIKFMCLSSLRSSRPTPRPRPSSWWKKRCAAMSCFTAECRSGRWEGSPGRRLR